MSLILTNTSNNENFVIDDIYTVYKVSNVLCYSYENYNSWKLKISSGNLENYYFIIDTLYDDAFAHWIFESAIYLPLYNSLKKIYPHLKLLLKQEKKYKKIFCDFFGIKDVVYNLESNNVCFFPSPISSLNNNDISFEWKTHVIKFKDCFSTVLDLKYEFVILPRQTAENYKNNDRTIDFNNLIKSLEKRSFVIETDKISDLNDQITKVNSSDKICLSEGSAFYVNGLFCKNKTIYVVDISETYKMQPVLYTKFNFLLNIIKEANNIVYISQNDLIRTLTL